MNKYIYSHTETRDFYSRPCGRGDVTALEFHAHLHLFLLTPLREGRPFFRYSKRTCSIISTHAPAGGATRKQWMATLDGRFLLTPLREGRPERKNNMAAKNNLFLLTPLREGRPAECYVSGAVRVFLLTPLREGRQTSFCFWHPKVSYFYSRPCGRGDDDSDFYMNTSNTISTHAPAGGATKARCSGSSSIPISTHAPAGGATVIARGFLVHDNFISTHAPAGGATWSSSYMRTNILGFLLTPLREGRPQNPSA